MLGAVFPAEAVGVVHEESDEPITRFEAPPLVIEEIPPVRFAHPRWTPVIPDWYPSGPPKAAG
jgi:hypothetical protein